MQQQTGFVANREAAAERVERLLRYDFKDRALLEEALTHSTDPRGSREATYQRLEFIGDAVLGLAFASLFYDDYPDLDEGELTALRSANTAEEKLARVAVRHGLYPLLRRHNCAPLDRMVRDFINSVSGTVPSSGDLKAPKVLADIVEAIAGAVYVDSNFDLDRLQEVALVLCAPIITKERLYKDPVSTLKLLGRKHRKKLVSVLKVPNATIDELGNVLVCETKQVSTTGLGNGSEDEVGEPKTSWIWLRIPILLILILILCNVVNQN
ncbi:hypothetical protein GUJ93_ZPchr0001g32383 [Zizania palustris]|uniref:RNase III domain-containing protein n=1 Tax=Zizania palustris TaxID=103762 RepID=A0A8J5RRB2_ZIZPA|nr:hypothetical protein GUJ93_ZPchr0001g32383 [Zizania palustris]